MSNKYVIDHIPVSTPNKRRPKKKMNAEYITIHNTGNPSSTAKNERAWLTNKSNDRQASYHIAIDEKEAIECLPLDEVGYHAGDGVGKGNYASIGIEICESGDYAKTIDNAVELVAKLLKERKWGVDKLRRHYDWSGKICPRLMYDKGTWKTWIEFKNKVDKQLIELSGVKPVEKPSKPTEKPVTNEVGVAEIIEDVWLHSGDKAVVGARIKLLKKGEKYKMYGESNGMYNLGAGKYASKKSIVIESAKDASFPLLKITSRVPEVRQLQTILRDRGYSIVVDGVFGVATQKAVKAYQKAVGLTDDGIVGKGTWTKLYAKEAYTGTATGDVWLHSKPDVLVSTRTTTLKKGTVVNIEADANVDMYKTNLGYVSKKYIIKKMK